MTVVVEDGSGVEGANSYASAADLFAYANQRGTPLAVTEAQANALLVQAMDYLEAKFGRRWQGERSNTAQALAWPRSGVYVDNVRIGSNEIPRELQYGQLAAAIEANSQDLLPNKEPAVVREKVGEIEVEYTNTGKRMSVSAFSKADALLRPLCVNGGLALAIRA
jgi:hypothetical protein